MPYRGYKYRLYPDSEAKAYFARCFGATRYCYNYCVRAYDAATAEGRAVSGYDIMAQVREHLNSLAWFSQVDYEIKESAPMRFDKALSKYKRHQANRPREHKKGERPAMSYTTGGTIHVDFKHGLVQLPKIGLVRARLHRTFSGEITSATVKREADGCYYISLCVHSESEAAPQKPHSEAGTVGIDVGLHHLATLSNGDTIDLPDTSRIDARIALLKARNERQHPGSRRYRRTSLQVSRLQHRLASIRRDAHHKAAARLCRDYDTICMETLNVEGMKKDANTAGGQAFNAQLHHAAPALLVERIRQKCADTGTTFVAIDRWEPTTKRCHRCGYTLPTIDLHTREWTCPECHAHHDRDHNAAINIRRCGLERLATIPKQQSKETLPPAEGNVKPAKKATAGRNLRTGKVTAAIVRPTRATVSRQPKAQIADGTAPPRLFHREPLAEGHPFRYFKLLPLAVMAGLPDHRVRLILEESRFADPAPEERDDVIKLLMTIRRVAASLNQQQLTDNDPIYTNFALGQMNKTARIDKVLREALHYEDAFSNWKRRKKLISTIDRINQIATVDFPNKLDAMAYKYLMPLMPLPEWEPFSDAAPLHREANVKPAAVGINASTGTKRATRNEPKSARKRIFPPIPDELRYVRINRVGMRSGVSEGGIKNWLTAWRDKRISEVSMEKFRRVLNVLQEVAAECRGAAIDTQSSADVASRLRAMNKMIDMTAFIRDRLGITNNFYAWAGGAKTPEQIAVITQFYTQELPDRIERYVANITSNVKFFIAREGVCQNQADAGRSSILK